MIRVFLLLLALLAPVFTSFAHAAEVQEDPLERQMLDIAKDLRCTVCQNQPVSESNADLAKDMRAIILEQLRQGKSRDEIVAYFVDRYGDYVLMKPRFNPLGAILWIAPVLLLVGLGAFAFVYLRRRVRPPETSSDVPKLSAEDQARVRRAREEVP